MAMRGCHNNNNKKLSEVIFIVGACDFPAPRKTKDENENEKDERRTSKHGGIWYVLMCGMWGSLFMFLLFYFGFWALLLSSSLLRLRCQCLLGSGSGLSLLRSDRTLLTLIM